MATLYIANCSKQAHEFLYRMPAENLVDRSRILTVRIEPGTQQQLVKDAPLPVLEAIVEQHRQYGLVAVSEVENTKSFVGLCYSFDKPVDVGRLEAGVAHRDGVLFERGEQLREHTALTIADTLEKEIGEPMQAVEMQTLEEGEAPKLGKAIRVTRDEQLRVSGGRMNGRRVL